MILFVQHVIFVMSAASFSQEASCECAFLIGIALLPQSRRMRSCLKEVAYGKTEEK